MPQRGLSEAPSIILIATLADANVLPTPSALLNVELITAALPGSICLGSSTTSG